jgi:hypothetical protein
MKTREAGKTGIAMGVISVMNTINFPNLTPSRDTVFPCQRYFVASRSLRLRLINKMETKAERPRRTVRLGKQEGREQMKALPQKKPPEEGLQHVSAVSEPEVIATENKSVSSESTELVRLSTSAIRLLAFFKKHADDAGSAIYTKHELAVLLDMSEKTVNRSIQKLLHEKAITATPRYAENGSRLANAYRLNEEFEFSVETRGRKTGWASKA